MNHESASYKRYKEELSDKTYVDYVMADGECVKLFSVNYLNTCSYEKFVEDNRNEIIKEIADMDSVVDVVKYIEFMHAVTLIQSIDVNIEVKDLAIRHLRISMKVNTNVSKEDVDRIESLFIKLGLLLNSEDILDYDSKVVPVCYSVRYTTIKLLTASMGKAGISNTISNNIAYSENRNRIMVDMVKWFIDAGLKVMQFYGSEYFSFKGMLFTYVFGEFIDFKAVHKFIDSFYYMLNVPTKYVLLLYNGVSQKDTVYKDTTIAVRNVTECMDKFLLEGLSFTKSFKSRIGN